jgi:hypothetical protein
MPVQTARKTLSVMICCAHVAGCASGPDSVEARYVSPTMYQTWTCEQLTEERTRLDSEVRRVAGLQRENANADAAMMTVGLILFWPMLFGLAATKDRANELGRLKGEYEAVEQSMKSKQCVLPPPMQPSATPAPVAPAGPAPTTPATTTSAPQNSAPSAAPAASAVPTGGGKPGTPRECRYEGEKLVCI